MNEKQDANKEESKINENSLTDLPVADEQSDSTKGGAAPNFAGTWTLEKSKSQ